MIVLNPLVSIVIPCYRGEKYLAAAIESCLTQTYSPIEVIVVDDASPDGCAAIADRFAASDSRLRVVRLSRNAGVSGAFNAGFRAAKGALFTRLAQDDVFQNDAIDIMWGVLATHPEVGLVYCDQQKIDEAGNIIGYVHGRPAEEALRAGNKVGLCVMWRASVWHAVGEFRPEFDSAEDYDYWERVSRTFRLAYCPGAAPIFMRMHSAMGSRTFRPKQQILSARIRARQESSWLRARQLLGRGYFEAGYILRMRSDRLAAAKYLLASIGYWPFDYKPYKSLLAAMLGRRVRTGD